MNSETDVILDVLNKRFDRLESKFDTLQSEQFRMKLGMVFVCGLIVAAVILCGKDVGLAEILKVFL